METRRPEEETKPPKGKRTDDRDMGLRIPILFLCLSAWATAAQGEDPYLFFTWNVTYGTISPLGVPQQAILINGQFPGPNINSTTNNNIVVNVFNNLDEPFLITCATKKELLARWCAWDQLSNSSGKELHLPFPSEGSNWKLLLLPEHRRAPRCRRLRGLRINSRLLIPVPYADPEDDYTVLIGDWYTESHTQLKSFLDSGRALGRPDGVLINGKSNKGRGKDEPLFTMKPGKTYKYRICNVGLKNSLNFRIQDHPMKLVEMEGSHTVQNTYESLDVHVGQCFGVLVTADKEPKDYLMVASTRFTKNVLTTTAIIGYTNGKRPASPEIPEAPVGWAWSLNQFRSFRWNLTASAARPNPQGSYHYGQINITRTIKLVNSASKVNDKLRYAINGVSHTEPETPLKLAEYYNVADKVFKYDVIQDDMPATVGDKVTVEPNVGNVTYRTFVEIILENRENSIQSWHLDGYSFFAVAVEPGRWTPDKRKNYNLLDAVSRHTVQVFPKSWAAIMLTFDNPGMWNLRSELLERRYLGQHMYISVLSPQRSLRDEYNIPDNALLCGIVKGMPKPPPYSV
ncbi:hypothetical protein NL676_005619 [Syzygium grande]|nr:hypothetical protein NL676_005619 [Syzygium grande]